MWYLLVGFPYGFGMLIVFAVNCYFGVGLGGCLCLVVGVGFEFGDLILDLVVVGFYWIC